MGTGRDLLVAERSGSLVRSEGVSMGVFGMLQGLPGMLRTSQVILLAAMLLGAAMGVRGDIMQFRRPLVIFVMRSVVIAGGHD